MWLMFLYIYQRGPRVCTGNTYSRPVRVALVYVHTLAWATCMYSNTYFRHVRVAHVYVHILAWATCMYR